MDLDVIKEIEICKLRSGDSIICDTRLVVNQTGNGMIDDYRNTAHSASGKIGEACIPLDRLAESLRREFLQDGRSDYEGLREEIEAFVNTGNRFSIPYEELCKLDPSPKMMFSMADELKKRYEEVIALEERKRKMIGLALLIAVPLVITVAFVAKKDQLNLSLAAMVATLLTLIKFVLDVLEAARNAKEDATKKKCEGAATVRGLASSFEILLHDLSQILSTYDELKTVLESTGTMMDKQHLHPSESEPNSRKEVTNLTWLVEKIKRKADDIKGQAVEVKKSAASAAKDVSVLNIVEDLAELYNNLPKDTRMIA